MNRRPAPHPTPSGDARSWTVGYRVRFDEAGPDGLLRPGVLLAYAQDCAWVHSTALGFDRTWYGSRGLAWLVRAVRLDLLAPIGSGSDLSVRTEVVGFRAASARRRTAIALDARLVAELLTDWALTDEAGRPVRVPAEILARFETAGTERPPAFAPLRMRATDDGPGAPVGNGLRDRVRRSDADPMGHLNNGRAVDLVDEALADTPAGRGLLGRFPRRYVVEYRAPVPTGTPLDLAVRNLGPGPGPAVLHVELRAVGAPGPAVVALVGAIAAAEPGSGEPDSPDRSR